jgi:hypothetical protein
MLQLGDAGFDARLGVALVGERIDQRASSTSMTTSMSLMRSAMALQSQEMRAKEAAGLR